IGSSGRVVLNDIPAGQHILRVSKPGERDDERVIEIREGANEQVIQAHLKTVRAADSQPSQGSSSGDVHSSLMPGIVACSNCNSRFAEGVRFCGRCGSRSFNQVSAGESPDAFPCPRCSNLLPENSRFCGRCGLSISLNTGASKNEAIGYLQNHQLNLPPQAERICRRCNESYPPNIKFCGRCGYTLN
ncbi:MAG: double zinc ribbon domain-containing protein, partial [Pyrinomonadaceae bacterium]